MGGGDCLQDAQYTMAEELRVAAIKYAGTWRLAQGIIMAIDNANQLIKNYRKQRDIADRSLKMAEAHQRHLMTVFWPRELSFMEEHCNPAELEDVETVGKRYAGRLVSSVAAEFAKQFKQLRCNASKYCISATNRIERDLILARAMAIGNAKVLGRMIAFLEIQKQSDLNFDRKLKAAGLGEGLMGEAASLMSKGAQGYAAIGQRIANDLSSSFAMIGSGVAMRGSQPARSSEMQDMLAGRTGVLNYTSPASFSGQSVDNRVDMDYRIDTSNMGGYRSAQENLTAWPSQQNQMQMNNGRVGNWDLARAGQYTYTDTDTWGKPIVITVDMNDFPLTYVDHKTQGDYTNAIG